MKWFLTAFLCISFVFLAAFGINCVYGYLFPIKYEEEIAAASEKFDVDKAIVFSVINTESRFNKDAVSPKGAVGLMQVMPSTALSLQTEMKETFPGKNDDMKALLKNPADNIMIGTFYLSKLLAKFENLQTALCAYNAGPTVVSGWLKKAAYSDDEKTLKKIPYVETSKYVERFNKNFKFYSQKVK